MRLEGKKEIWNEIQQGLKLCIIDLYSEGHNYTKNEQFLISVLFFITVKMLATILENKTKTP